MSGFPPNPRYRKGAWSACGLFAVALLGVMASACAVPPGHRTAPRRVQDPTDARSLERWTPAELRRRAADLEGSLLERGDRDDSQVRLRHHLATVYLALGRQSLRTAMRQLERAHDIKQWWRADERQRLGRAYRLHRALAKQWRWRAMYQWLEALHSPDSGHYDHIDQVVHGAAEMLLDAAETEANLGWPGRDRRPRQHGFELMERLVRVHPTSRYVGRALLVLGKALRKQGRPESAALAFRKILRGPWTASHSRAHLGLGRCLMDVNRPRTALRQFIRAHQRAAHGQRYEVRSALFTAWAITGRAADGYKFCRGVAAGHPQNTRALFTALATWCQRNGRPAFAGDLWLQALRRWPRDPHRCRWWQEAVEGFATRHRWQSTGRLLSGAKALVGSVTRQLGTRSKRTTACRSRVQKTLKKLAVKLSHGAIRSRSLAMVNASRRAFTEYAAIFPRARDAYPMASHHAKLLWRMVQLNLRSTGPARREAARLLDRLAREKRPAAMGLNAFRTQQRDNALAAIRSWITIADWESYGITNRTRGLAGPRPCLRRGTHRCTKWGAPSLRRRAVTADRHRLLGAFKQYLKVAEPKSRFRGTVQFYVADLYWRHNHLTKALPQMLTLAFSEVREHPAAARAAAFRAYHVLIALKHRARAARLLDRILRHRRLMNDWSFRAQMRRLKTDIQWRRAEALRARKRWRECGELFSKLAERAKARRGAAYQRSADCYDSAGLPGKAIRTLLRLLAHHRKSRHAPAVTLRVARTFQRAALLSNAAKWFERYVDRFPERADAPAVHLEALAIRAGLGSWYALKTQLASFLGRYGVTHTRLAARARWIWIRFVQSRGRTNLLPGLLRGWLKHHAGSGPVDRFLEASVRLATRAWRRSCRVAPTGGRCLAAPRKPRVSPARRALLQRAPKLVRTAVRVLTRASRAWAGGQLLKRISAKAPDRPARVRRTRRYAAQVAKLLLVVKQYRRCRRSGRCRSGRVVSKRTSPSSQRPPGERWRKTTPPSFRNRPAGFYESPLGAPGVRKK